MKIRLTLAMAVLAGSTVFAGTRMDVLNAKSKTIGEAMATMLQQSNKPFSVGASGEDAYDNPGLAVFMFKQLGLDVPADMQKLSKIGKTISKPAKMQAGDIVFFVNPQNKKELGSMGVVQSVAADGLSFMFFYADQKQGIVRIASSTEPEFNGHFKQANRITSDEELAKIRDAHQKEVENINKATDKLTKAQAAVKAAETELQNLESAFAKKNEEALQIK